MDMRRLKMSEKLTMLNTAISKGCDYADDWEDHIVMLLREEGMSMHAVIKNSYTQGFLDGFKFRLTGDSE